jgi:hypothetical protein
MKSTARLRQGANGDEVSSQEAPLTLLKLEKECERKVEGAVLQKEQAQENNPCDPC